MKIFAALAVTFLLLGSAHAGQPASYSEVMVRDARSAIVSVKFVERGNGMSLLNGDILLKSCKSGDGAQTCNCPPGKNCISLNYECRCQ